MATRCKGYEPEPLSDCLAVRMIQTFSSGVLGFMHVAVSVPQRQESRSVSMNSSPVSSLGDASDPGLHDRLIQAVALRRDREAFARLFAYFAPRLKAWLIKSGAAPAAAEDFAQDAMLTVWRKADLFDARKSRAATWIFTIARNRRLDMLRRDSRPLPTPEIELAREDGPGPETLLTMSQDAQRVRAAMASLTPDQIEVLHLAFYVESPHSEIAQRLDLPLGTVKSRIRNAMIKLRLMLEPSQEASR